MKRAIRLPVLVILLGLLLPVGGASGEQAPPGPSTVLQSQFEIVAPSTPFDLELQVVEWQPGAWGTVHTHPGAVYIMLLEGETTNSAIVDSQRTEPTMYRPGDVIVEQAWGIYEAGNPGAVRARNLLVMLQPKDTPFTITMPMESAQPGAPPPRIVHLARTEVVNVSGPVDLYETWWEWSPGARTTAHFHPGVELGIVTEGELTVTKATGATTVRAGESFVNSVGEVHTISNDTSERASLVTAHLVASGRPLSFAAE